MSETKSIRVVQEQPAPRRIPRRELAQTLLSGLAVSFLSPLTSAVHPLHKHLLNGSLLDSADTYLSAENRKPLFLSEKQFAALDVVSEAFVPGSRKAQVSSFIDLLLSADTHEAQQNFLGSLSAIETVSQSMYHAEISALSSNQVHGLLTALSATGVEDQSHFDQLKDWIAGAYYSSEIGMRELGWTPDRVFSTFPACAHPYGHA
jgi:hypothetical protein